MIFLTLLSLALGMELTGSGPNLSFREPVANYNSDAPSAIAVGDWNADGLIDYAVTNYFDNSVSIALGLGRGRFVETAAKIPVGAAPNAIVSADINGDGFSDIIVANSGEQRITIATGKGDGSFEAPYDILISCAPSDLLVSDFDQDSHLDLIIGSTGPTGGCIELLRRIAGEWLSLGCHQLASSPKAMSITRPDRAGNRNLYYSLAEQEGLFRMAIGLSGEATDMQIVVEGVRPSQIEVLDIDQDGHLDAAMLDSASGMLMVEYGVESKQSLSTDSLLYHLGGMEFMLSDLNGDGFYELVSSSSEMGTIEIHRQSATGAFNKVLSADIGTALTSIAVIDTDRDGLVDLLATDFGGKSIYAMLQFADKSSFVPLLHRSK